METQTIAVPRLGYSLAEAEVACGLSRASLYRLISAGKLETVQLGRRRIVPTEALAAIMRPAAKDS